MVVDFRTRHSAASLAALDVAELQRCPAPVGDIAHIARQQSCSSWHDFICFRFSCTDAKVLQRHIANCCCKIQWSCMSLEYTSSSIQQEIHIVWSAFAVHGRIVVRSAASAVCRHASMQKTAADDGQCHTGLRYSASVVCWRWIFFVHLTLDKVQGCNDLHPQYHKTFSCSSVTSLCPSHIVWMD